MFGTMTRWLGAGVICAVVTAMPAPSKAETLADTLMEAYNHSGLLDQNRALLRAADEDVAAIVSELRPILNWSADVTRNFGRSRTSGIARPATETDMGVALTLDLLLYDFGQTRYRIDAAKESVLATRELLRSIEQQVLLRAVTAYLDVRRNGEFVALRENNLRLLRQELRAARDRFEVGEVTRTDVAQAEARLAEAQSGLAAAQGELQQAIEEFRTAVGRAPGNLRAPRATPDLTNTVAESRAIAVRNHPDMREAQHQVAAADLTILAAEAAMKPEIGLTGRAGLRESFDDDDFSRTGSFGVTVRGPIYQGGLLSSAKRRAMAQRDARRGNLHVVRHRISQDVGNAYAILRAARAVQQSSREQVRAARVAFQGVREEAKLGARTTLDVLNAEQSLLDAQTNLISADTDVLIAAYRVLASIGQLTAKDLNLNVQTYDPAAYYNLVKDAPVPISPQGEKLDRVLRALGKD
ncbi:TolC family outer membrane protein [Roseovarius aestuariivivens]|uniref:TolC family outer membrane protein n=1 Tax=Roseovarius aestuariivivens TaxID=1888910 RepID=UPI0010810D2F|nr:TolC family outer membrane protein [Roseovarius aestuariivivens]